MSTIRGHRYTYARWATLLLLLAYAIPGAVVYFAQDQLIFRASRTMDSDPSSQNWTFEELRLPVTGEETYAWYIPLEGHRGVALYSHGNGGSLSHRLGKIALLRRFGFSVLAYDYGGFGNSTGTPSEDRCYADIRAAWDYLVNERGVAPKEILLFGRSLGGGPTVDLAQQVTPGAVILENTYLSMADTAWETPYYRPWIPFIRHQFPSKDKIASIAVPLLVMHSKNDEIIPFTHGQRLFDLATAPKTFVELPGEHNNGYASSEALYEAAWDTFLTPIFGPWPPEVSTPLENTPGAPVMYTTETMKTVTTP